MKRTFLSILFTVPFLFIFSQSSSKSWYLLFSDRACGPSDLNSPHSRGFIIPDPHSKGN